MRKRATIAEFARNLPDLREICTKFTQIYAKLRNCFCKIYANLREIYGPVGYGTVCSYLMQHQARTGCPTSTASRAKARVDTPSRGRARAALKTRVRRGLLWEDRTRPKTSRANFACCFFWVCGNCHLSYGWSPTSAISCLRKIPQNFRKTPQKYANK